jgi:TetR/AcrR family transcriptional repressor of lmrAB and yxaGH operons
VAAAGKHRETILAAAARLFRRQGYSGTGLAEILAESGAPKGSLYHYFPAGKAEIGAAAVGFAGQLVTRSLERLAKEHQTPEAFFRAYAGQLAGWMAQSNWQAGCPIATVLLEASPDDAAITQAGAEAFAAWTRVFADSLTAHGVPPDRARRLARLAITAIEGALILARVEQSAEPILTTAEEIAELILTAREAAVAGAKTSRDI